MTRLALVAGLVSWSLIAAGLVALALRSRRLRAWLWVAADVDAVEVLDVVDVEDLDAVAVRGLVDVVAAAPRCLAQPSRERLP